MALTRRLAAAGRSRLRKTLRERLQRHRADEACSGCHDKIDPLGFALESFDAIGRIRDLDEAGARIDDAARTRDGHAFAGLSGLRSYLQGREPEFYNIFARKLIGYSLGRSVMPSDKLLIAEIQQKLLSGDGTFSSAVTAVVQSRQFGYRRND